MKKTPITEDSLDRLAKALMEKHQTGYDEACQMLSQMRLHAVCDESIVNSVAKQAALLTLVNSGKRAFHGGVYVKMPANVRCLLPWPTGQSLNSIVSSLGGSSNVPQSDRLTQTIYIGSTTDPVEDSLSIFCTGWRGGIAPSGTPLDMSSEQDFATGGVLAGGLAVAIGFLQVSGISSRSLDEPYGISLWRPDLSWLDPLADGPPLESLPKALWILGLGHLGQAYLWNLGLLPYQQPGEATFLLQDFDAVVEGNFSSQLLCEQSTVGIKKTRVCCQWLEERGFKTIITERPFDETTKRSGDEPYVALCGFDKAKPRRSLENAGFDLIVECALGGNTARFDRIILHTFPEARNIPSSIWLNDEEARPDQLLVDAFQTNEDCGILAETLAKKAVSSSFVGAVAGALVTGEVLRALHSGIRCELIQTHLRHNSQPGVIVKDEVYALRVVKSGFCSAKLPRPTHEVESTNSLAMTL